MRDMFCHTHLTPCYTQKNAQAKEPLLSHSELETLLHEFGHVLHSVLGRTQFQHLSGTRSVADVVEVIVFCGVFLCYSCCFASKVADLEVLSVFCNFEVMGVCGSEGSMTSTVRGSEGLEPRCCHRPPQISRDHMQLSLDANCTCLLIQTALTRFWLFVGAGRP